MDVLRLLTRLGVTQADLERVRDTPYPQSIAVLDDLKLRVRQSWKRLAFELHPDRTGNDPDKTEEFKELTKVRGDFEKLQVQPAPAYRPGIVIWPPRYAAQPYKNAATTTNVDVRRYVHIRPT